MLADRLGAGCRWTAACRPTRRARARAAEPACARRWRDRVADAIGRGQHRLQLGARRHRDQQHLGQPPAASGRHPPPRRARHRWRHRPEPGRWASRRGQWPLPGRRPGCWWATAVWRSTWASWPPPCQERTGLVLLVMNDGGYGILRSLQDADYGGHRCPADLHTPALRPAGRVADHGLPPRGLAGWPGRGAGRGRSRPDRRHAGGVRHARHRPTANPSPGRRWGAAERRAWHSAIPVHPVAIDAPTPETFALPPPHRPHHPPAPCPPRWPGLAHPRNLLFIMCDQLRADHLSCYAQPGRCARIDALAARCYLQTRPM